MTDVPRRAQARVEILAKRLAWVRRRLDVLQAQITGTAMAWAEIPDSRTIPATMQALGRKATRLNALRMRVVEAQRIAVRAELRRAGAA